MADNISLEQIESFLRKLGERYLEPATLYLLGGGALILLGSTRGTLDIDYVGIDIPGKWNDLQRTIDQLGTEMDLKIEAVPYDEMVPPLPDSAHRNISIAQYGSIQVYVVDPYAMALGKLDRGFPTDLADIGYMVSSNLVTLAQLEEMMNLAIPQVEKFDLTPKSMRANLETVRRLLDKA